MSKECPEFYFLDITHKVEWLIAFMLSSRQCFKHFLKTPQKELGLWRFSFTQDDWIKLDLPKKKDKSSYFVPWRRKVDALRVEVILSPERKETKTPALKADFLTLFKARAVWIPVSDSSFPPDFKDTENKINLETTLLMQICFSKETNQKKFWIKEQRFIWEENKGIDYNSQCSTTLHEGKCPSDTSSAAMMSMLHEILTKANERDTSFKKIISSSSSFQRKMAQRMAPR